MTEIDEVFLEEGLQVLKLDIAVRFCEYQNSTKNIIRTAIEIPKKPQTVG